MSDFNNQKPQCYSFIAQVLHWAVAIFIVWAFVIGLMVDGLPRSPEKINLFVLHKSAGITVLMLLVVRIVWRFIKKPPALGLSQKEERLARLGHWALYALMFLVPFSGWALNSTGSYPLPWFNLFDVPRLPGLGEGLHELLEETHVFLAYTLAVLVAGHVTMLFHHKFAHKLNLLPRMLPRPNKVWGVGLLAVLAALLGYVMSVALSVETEQQVEPAPSAIIEQGQSSTNQSNQPHWVMITDQSSLTFTASYSGSPFKGSIKDFDPNFYFDPDKPGEGMIDVMVATDSITTGESDWDGELPGQQWFAVAQFPQAHFISRDIQALGDNKFAANGELTIKGITAPVTVNFQWLPSANGTVDFNGGAQLDRRTFNVGSGSWADDDSISFFISIGIDLTLTPN